MQPVTWRGMVRFAGLSLDGKEANALNIGHKHDVLNIWREHDAKHDAEAGNDMVLGLKPVPLPPNNKCTLNHYPKALAESESDETGGQRHWGGPGDHPCAAVGS